jgi:hypothetical protein
VRGRKKEWKEGRRRRLDDDEVGLLETEGAPAFQLGAFVSSRRAITTISLVLFSSLSFLSSVSVSLGLDVEGLFGVAQFGEEFTGGEGAMALESLLTFNETRFVLASGERRGFVFAGVEGHLIGGGTAQTIRGVEGFLSTQIEDGLSH